MSYLTSLFQRIASDINRPISDFQSFITILQQNWYDTQQAIRQITSEQFDSMKIPKRIVAKIRQYTSAPSKQETQVQGMVRQQHQQQQNWEQPHVSQVTNFDMMYKKEMQYEDTFRQLVLSLQHQTTNNKTKIMDCLKLLIKIVQNIIQNPDNEKFKVIKLTSNALKNNILCYDACNYIVEFIGFIKTNQQILMLEPNLSHLKSCRRNLEIELESVSKMHDPYQASFNSSTLMPNMINSSEEGKDEKNYNEMLDKLIEHRREKMSHPPEDRKARIYHKKFEMREYDVNAITLEEEFNSTNDPILKQYYQKLSSQNTDSSKFQNKRKLEFQLLSKQPIYESTLIRIKLPNEYILQGTFGPYETVGSVIQFAHQYLDGEIYIFTTPPVVYMNKHKDKSLVEMECVPLGIFFLGVEGPWQVKPQYVQFIQA